MIWSATSTYAPPVCTYNNQLTRRSDNLYTRSVKLSFRTIHDDNNHVCVYNVLAVLYVMSCGK